MPENVTDIGKMLLAIQQHDSKYAQNLFHDMVIVTEFNLNKEIRKCSFFRDF